MSALAALTALTLSCATCPPGQFPKGCDALGNNGTCTACRACPKNSVQQNPCSGPFDTACRNETCNASTSCQGLFCNYPADTMISTSCRLAWTGADAALGPTFLCTRPALQGKCAPPPLPRSTHSHANEHAGATPAPQPGRPAPPRSARPAPTASRATASDAPHAAASAPLACIPPATPSSTPSRARSVSPSRFSSISTRRLGYSSRAAAPSTTCPCASPTSHAPSDSMRPSAQPQETLPVRNASSLSSPRQVQCGP